MLWLYGLPLFLILLFYFWKQSKQHNANLQVYTETIESGLTEPASLHPEVNHSRCLGCASCVTACPEKNILGVIAGKANLINPTQCIGHGACKKSCPFDAIELVFGTEKRGVDIPQVGEDFQTNVPGIFIAGELGGMGLIRNAITQGVQAVDSIRKMTDIGSADKLDLVIVGAGPAGVAAALAAKSHNLKFSILEQDTLGGTVSHYPRGKIVMTAPVTLPIIGKMHFKETTKEALMSFWQDVVDKAELEITEKQSVESIEKEESGFLVKTRDKKYQSHAVLLTIGRRGTPRKLGVHGEELSKVVYRLIDPQQYRNQNVLIVGGGDSALEAAVSIAEEEGTNVTISYRSEAFSRAKEKNRNKITTAEQQGRLKVMLQTTVKKINADSVAINSDNEIITIDNDAVIVCAGGILPTKFLENSGIAVETKFGTA